MLACCFPCSNDDLWRLNEYAHLIDDGGLDFCGGHAADGACLRAPFDQASGDVIAIQSLAAARVCRREREAIGTEQQALERRHAIPATSIRCSFARAHLQDGVDLVPEIARDDWLMLSGEHSALVYALADVRSVVEQDV